MSNELSNYPYSGLWMFVIVFEDQSHSDLIEPAISNSDAEGCEKVSALEYLLGEDLLDNDFDINFENDVKDKLP